MRRTKPQAMETRDAILDAAETVFHARGVALTTLAQIASAANVTRGAIYWHFKGKTELFEAMTARASTPEEVFFLQQAETACGATLTGLEILSQEMVRRFLASERSQRVHEILLFRCEYVGEMGRAMQRRWESEDAFDSAVLDAFRRANQSSDGLGEGWTPELATAALRCSLMGALADWLRRERGYDLLEVATVLLRSLFASFRVTRLAN